MGVFTFVCRSSGDEWTGKSLSGELEASAPSTFDLQRKLVHTALSADSSGGVQSSFSLVTPTSAVFQVSPSLSLSLSFGCFLLVGCYIGRLDGISKLLAVLLAY
ncbi:60S acidic ribosomal protein P3-2 isoform X2 [Juglans microcarpa x Juglans regia]|uniref:60S acidic ribosomal protein P3-2 isoform X2 n=1 Tax=Juglans microcarpa x Juglans regia TaxID=2249226 RepID=UPI001B7EC504|nr:60S acidic ribosomal protein P3-2 isoform X2 [Juglans microcarpa x Juglans regia]